MKKVALFAFNGDPMCFVHVLLTALDMQANQVDVKVVIEGSATKLINDLNEEDATFHNLYVQVKEAGLIDCACKACSAKLGVTEAVTAENLPLVGDMSGHPAMEKFIADGYQIITF